MLSYRFLLLKHTTLTHALHRYCLSITIIFNCYFLDIESVLTLAEDGRRSILMMSLYSLSVLQNRDEVIVIWLTLILHRYIVQLTKAARL